MSTAGSASRCPVCEATAFRPVVTIPEVPATVGDCYPSREESLQAPVGAIELAVCESCGLLRNLAFDESLLVYGPGYENSQMFSPTFRAYAEALADDLVARYGLAGGRVVEIGCGKGEFLRVLADAGVADAVGYDVSYDGEVDDRDGVRVVRELYGEGPVPRADLLVTRHVVEHLAEPRETLAALRAAVGADATPLYVEVPDASFVTTGGGMWDVIYPHVSYFGVPTMRTLFERAGWRPTDVGSVFGGQFLAAHGDPAEPAFVDRRAEVDAFLAGVADFGARMGAAIERWPEELERRAPAGPVVLWGAGAKGVSFLSLPSVAGRVDAVVDVNVRKHGTYIPCTGHRIVAPDELRSLEPATVLITNSLYEDEIRAQLRGLDLRPDVVGV